MGARVGLSIQPQDDYRDAAQPLLEAGEVEVLEWTIDNGWAARIPEWATPWLNTFGARDALYAHGFSFSLLGGRWTPRHETWLKLLGMEIERRHYQHLSEHFCFVTAGDFLASAPLPVPLDAGTLALGQARLRKLADRCGLPVGLENLATALSPRDVYQQGEFLDALLAPVDGFVLLDVHNLFCQAHNFDVDADRLLDGYPLERVREIHVSGGSWDQSEHDPRPFRRDTHDEAVPDDVFALCELALGRCPNVATVFFERLGGTIAGERDAARFAADYRRLVELVHAER